MISEGQVGPQWLADGASQAFRMTKLAALVISDLHGRFYEQCYRNNLFSFGISNTALVAANAIVTGVSTAAQPVIGVWNPLSSPVNLVILQASVTVTTVANTMVSPGGFMWLGSAGNAALTLGSTPISCKSLVAAGSNAKAYAVSTALTGLTNNLAIMRAAAFSPPNAAGVSPAVSLSQGVCVENVDGSIICPPGGVVAIMNQVSTTTVSVSSGLLWEEVPI
jgi:hypothetical protein